MKIHLTIGGVPATLTRGWVWGGMKLVASGRCTWLQHPLNPGTHFDIRRKRSWERDVDGHKVRVEKTRPLLFAGFRDQHFTIFVDGTLAASANGK